MSRRDTHRMVEFACDGDRQPNAARKYMTIEDCERAHAQKLAEGGEQSHVDAGVALGEA